MNNKNHFWRRVSAIIKITTLNNKNPDLSHLSIGLSAWVENQKFELL